MSSDLRRSLITRIRSGKASRERFVESHLVKGIAHQIRSTRERLGWNQAQLAEQTGMKQSAISRLESIAYGQLSVKTIRRVAAALDVGLIVRLVPFSEMVDWASGTPRINPGLSTESLAVPGFAEEESDGALREPRAMNTQLDQRFAGFNFTPKYSAKPLTNTEMKMSRSLMYVTQDALTYRFITHSSTGDSANHA